MKDVVIRLFNKKDINQVAWIMAEAFKHKFSSLKKMHNHKISNLFIDLGFVDDYECDGYYVAEYNNQVVGAMKLKWHNQRKIYAKRKVSFITLIKKYGFIQVMHLLLGMCLLEDKIGKEELYIEFIAVDKECRGRGIGKELIKQGIRFGRINPGFHKIALHVAKKNTGAFRLYEFLGFSTTGIINSLLTNFMLKHRHWFYMCRALEQPLRICDNEEELENEFDEQSYTLKNNVYDFRIIHSKHQYNKPLIRKRRGKCY